MKNNSTTHAIFWLLYFIFCYVSDLIIDPDTHLSSVVIFYVSQNLFLFYGWLHILKSFSHKRKNRITISIIKLISLISVFFVVRYYLRYHFLAIYVDPLFGTLEYDVWFVNGILWIVNYFFLSSAYFYSVSSIRQQETIREINEHNHSIQKHQLELENALLRAQINPHFLYNSLNYIYSKSLPYGELSQAILKMSEIMRYSLEKQDYNGFVLLSAESTQIRNVVEMARLRFDNRIFIELNISSDLDGFKIIPLALITLVENVLKHGKLNDPNAPAQIELRIEEGQELHFSTWNRKRVGSKEPTTNIGLKNTIRRLEEAYGAGCRGVIDDADDSFHTHLRLNLIS